MSDLDTAWKCVVEELFCRFPEVFIPRPVSGYRLQKNINL